MKRKVTVTTPSDLEIAVTRVFHAPRHLVWEAHTRPELLKRWGGGPPGWSMTVCESDFRVGGAWRWVIEGPNGERMVMHGVHLEIVPEERISRSESFEPSWYAGEAVGTMTLVERGGETTLTVIVRYASKEIRDAVLQSPMADGMEMGYESLDALLLNPIGS